MSRFARFSPKGRPEDELPTRIADLHKGTYLAVQRTLENIWFGSGSLASACQHIRMEYDVDVDELDVQRTIAQFVNLLVRKIAFADQPISIETIKSLHWIIKEDLYKGIVENAPKQIDELRLKAKELSAILDPLRSEVLEKDRYVKEFRERKRHYDRNFANYQHKVEELKKAEQQLEADLQAIAGLSPIDIGTMGRIVQSLADGERKTE